MEREKDIVQENGMFQYLLSFHIILFRASWILWEKELRCHKFEEIMHDGSQNMCGII